MEARKEIYYGFIVLNRRKLTRSFPPANEKEQHDFEGRILSSIYQGDYRQIDLCSRNDMPLHRSLGDLFQAVSLKSEEDLYYVPIAFSQRGNDLFVNRLYFEKTVRGKDDRDFFYFSTNNYAEHSLDRQVLINGFKQKISSSAKEIETPKILYGILELDSSYTSYAPGSKTEETRSANIVQGQITISPKFFRDCLKLSLYRWDENYHATQLEEDMIQNLPLQNPKYSRTKGTRLPNKLYIGIEYQKQKGELVIQAYYQPNRERERIHLQTQGENRVTVTVAHSYEVSISLSQSSLFHPNKTQKMLSLQEVKRDAALAAKLIEGEAWRHNFTLYEFALILHKHRKHPEFFKMMVYQAKQKNISLSQLCREGGPRIAEILLSGRYAEPVEGESVFFTDKEIIDIVYENRRDEQFYKRITEIHDEVRIAKQVYRAIYDLFQGENLGSPFERNTGPWRETNLKSKNMQKFYQVAEKLISQHEPDKLIQPKVKHSEVHTQPRRRNY